MYKDIHHPQKEEESSKDLVQIGIMLSSNKGGGRLFEEKGELQFLFAFLSGRAGWIKCKEAQAPILVFVLLGLKINGRARGKGSGFPPISLHNPPTPVKRKNKIKKKHFV